DVDRLARESQTHHRGKERKRNGEDDDERAAKVAQEQQHHEAGEQGADDAFDQESARGVLDVYGLIELEIDVDVFGNQRAHARQRRLERVDHRHRRSVGALGDRHVDGTVTVYEGDVVDDVGAVLD